MMGVDASAAFHGFTRPVSDSGALALLRVDEAAAVLGLSDEGVRGLVRSGRLKAYRLGGGPKARIRIPSAAVAELLRATSDNREQR